METDFFFHFGIISNWDGVRMSGVRPGKVAVLENSHLATFGFYVFVLCPEVASPNLLGRALEMSQ